MEKLNYCSTCSEPLSFLDKNYFCNNCDTAVYLDPKVAVAAIIFQNEKILLVKRAINPSMGNWSFPSGFVDRGEKLEDALEREESCGAHFREEYQTEDGEALRNDKEYSHISAWEYVENGESNQHIESLSYSEIQPYNRSYK